MVVKMEGALLYSVICCQEQASISKSKMLAEMGITAMPALLLYKKIVTMISNGYHLVIMFLKEKMRFILHCVTPLGWGFPKKT